MRKSFSRQNWHNIENDFLFRAAAYNDRPHLIIVDELATWVSPSSTWNEFVAVVVNRSEVEVYPGLTKDEHYYQPFWNTLRKRMVDYPRANKHLTLALFIKAMKDELGLSGVVPSTTVREKHLQVNNFPWKSKQCVLFDKCTSNALETSKGMEKHIENMKKPFSKAMLCKQPTIRHTNLTMSFWYSKKAK